MIRSVSDRSALAPYETSFFYYFFFIELVVCRWLPIVWAPFAAGFKSDSALSTEQLVVREVCSESFPRLDLCLILTDYV